MMYPRPWSYSALKNFETCAKRYYHLQVRKDVKEGYSEHLAYGDQLHKAFQNRVAKNQPLPIGMRSHEPLLANLASLEGRISVEQKLAINGNYAPCEWFAQDVWFRCVVDFLLEQPPRAMIIDYKTGKRKEDDTQLALTGIAVLLHLDEVREVHSSFVWLQEPKGNQLETLVVHRDDLPDLMADILPRVERFQRAFRHDEFPANPSNLCRKYCPVASCPHHGK